MDIPLGHDAVERRRHLEIGLHLADRIHRLPRRLDALLARCHLIVTGLGRLFSDEHVVSRDHARCGGRGL